MISDILKNSLETALQNLSLEEGVSLEHPANIENGDYSSNIAMILAKKAKENPMELATKIVCELEKNLPKEVKRVEAVEPGFINFYLSDEFLKNSVADILEKGESFGKNESLKGQKVIIEYTDPNPFKEFHIGHLMSNTVGESLSRIIEFSRAETKRANYQGDVGLHVAKAVFGLKVGKKLKEAYAYGVKEYEENETAKKEIEGINKKLYEKSDDEIKKIYEEGLLSTLEKFESIYELIGMRKISKSDKELGLREGIHFDFYLWESETGPRGKKIVEDNIGEVFEIGNDGAVIFRGENYRLHTRVFITSKGLPTYEAKELGLLKSKEERFEMKKWFPTQSIVVTGDEINEYFKVVMTAAKKIGGELKKLAEKTEHIGHGMMRLSTGKMSSRTGDVISAESLINETKEKVLDVTKDRELANQEEIAEIVAIAALKYSILKQSIGKDIIFDINKSVSFDGDSGPYLQYSYVRAKSLLAKGGQASLEYFKRIYGPEKILYRFPEVVERALAERAPHYIATYLTELASEFNSFYGKEQVVNDKDESYKLALAEAVSITLKNGLFLLGIKAPDKM